MMPPAIILLVDDDRDVRTLASEILTGSGFQVLAANDAEAALEVWKKHGPPDLLLTDVVMPGRSGIELARELTELQPALPVVFMSGFAATALRGGNALPPGAAFLPKPFSVADLVAVVRGRLSSAPRARRVLIVDDEAAISVPMVHYFRQLGCATDVAAEAEEAAALAMHNRYDVAILDLRLTQWGGGEGLQVVDELRRSNREAAIVVLSAYADEESEREARRRGADAVLRKPCPLPTLARLAFELIGEPVV